MIVCPSLCLWTVYQCHGACVEVDSDTEAVAGRGFKLGCISCKRRSEVEGLATVEWYFRAKGEADFVHVSASPPLLKCIYNVTPAHDTYNATQYGLKEILCASSGCFIKQKLFIYVPTKLSFFPSLSTTFTHIRTSSYTLTVLDHMTASSPEVVVRVSWNQFWYFTRQRSLKLQNDTQPCAGSCVCHWSVQKDIRIILMCEEFLL